MFVFAFAFAVALVCAFVFCKFDHRLDVCILEVLVLLTNDVENYKKKNISDRNHIIRE